MWIIVQCNCAWCDFETTLTGNIKHLTPLCFVGDYVIPLCPVCVWFYVPTYISARSAGCMMSAFTFGLWTVWLIKTHLRADEDRSLLPEQTQKTWSKERVGGGGAQRTGDNTCEAIKKMENIYERTSITAGNDCSSANKVTELWKMIGKAVSNIISVDMQWLKLLAHFSPHSQYVIHGTRCFKPCLC